MIDIFEYHCTLYILILSQLNFKLTVFGRTELCRNGNSSLKSHLPINESDNFQLNSWIFSRRKVSFLIGLYNKSVLIERSLKIHFLILQD